MIQMISAAGFYVRVSITEYGSQMQLLHTFAPLCLLWGLPSRQVSKLGAFPHFPSVTSLLWARSHEQLRATATCLGGLGQLEGHVYNQVAGVPQVTRASPTSVTSAAVTYLEPSPGPDHWLMFCPHSMVYSDLTPRIRGPNHFIYEAVLFFFFFRF